ncbi:hypothetical protein QBA57_21165 [Streptomyces scabiei]|uniref:hypothetical protein n=1 Tax=Streptomyces scabiei TaxID=1930 RepID=UPI001FF0DC3C|nr:MULTISPECIES: hypothetical protein [Streptomyces]MDW8474035.1 hypothetical protein [Streptomyces scabiei]MDX2568551.1 hypothetical protein [Streptomyces scabiei]MDX2627480.1 hypothetical protein [Streptomyces scabiei]MDX3148987.1 hypothetical protein [Streptomyces scabiei]MDX3156428.1 hypothetical protein [Streptomyces scabiei]
MRHITRGLVTAGAVLLSTFAIPGTAHAAAPVVQEASSDSADWSVIDVRLGHGSAAGEDVKKITAKLRPLGSADTDTPVATVTEFTQTYFASPWAGTWSSPPVHLDTLGEYTIDVEATTSGGETTVQQNAGVLRYQKQPVISGFSVTPTEPTIDDKLVTATGDLLLRDPATRATEAMPDASVDIDLGSSVEQTVTTDDQGHFSLAREVSQGGWARAEYRSDLGYATVPWVSITPKAAATRLLLDKSSFHVVANAEMKVTGRLEYRSGTEWKPLAGIPLELDYKNSSITDATEATSDPAGRFTFVRRVYGDTTFEVGFPPYPYNPWIQRTATADVKAKVTSTSRFTEFTAAQDERAQLDITGSVDLSGNYYSGRIKVGIQYSADGKTGWTTKKTVTTGFGSQFIVEGLKGNPDGYWRLRYAGDTKRDFKGTTSKAMRKVKALTRIKGAGASPEPVSKNHTLTVKGVLQEAKPASTVGWTSWKAYGGKQVQILFRPRGEKDWYLMGTVKTKANGSFAKGIKAPMDGTWVPVHLEPDGKHFAGAGAEDYVDVR